MHITTGEMEQQLLTQLQAFQSAPPYMRDERRKQLLSQVDKISTQTGGIELLYQHIPELVGADIFEHTAWAAPEHLIHTLVGGTLLGSYPGDVIEVLSELRLLAIAEERIIRPHFSAAEARAFLQRTLVRHFDLVFADFSRPVWEKYSRKTLQRVRLLFDFILQYITLDELKASFLYELKVITAQRPIVIQRVERILAVIHQKLALHPDQETDREMLSFVDALYRPTAASSKYPAIRDYRAFLNQANENELQKECQLIGQQYAQTGLISHYQYELISFLCKANPKFIPVALSLNPHGMADFERHQDFTTELIRDYITPVNRHALMGLARVLERNLLGRKLTRNALRRLIRTPLHPEVAAQIQKGTADSSSVTPTQLLIGGTLLALGHPLGIRQGNNPTCQSARGISMWSQHAPGKLINLLIDMAGSNNIIMRFEGDVIESANLSDGLIQQMDYKLDPVSLVLVPQLDKIYNEMMRRATLKRPGIDPHVSVNPAFYGQWIQTGFQSVYDPLQHAIVGYKSFVRIFYASFHPEFNGEHRLIYPAPMGIFITDSRANFQGFHAISLLRIAKDQHDKWRAYFFNPNSEGKQNWGQQIEPTVASHKERAGESSLPVAEFVSRVYAFHYNALRLDEKTEKIPTETVEYIEKLARDSWGRKYKWL